MVRYRCANCGYQMQSPEVLGEGAALCPKCRAQTLVALPQEAEEPLAAAIPVARSDEPEDAPPPAPPEDPLGDLVSASRAALSKAIAPKPGARTAGSRAAGARSVVAARVAPRAAGARYAGPPGATAPYAVAALIVGILSVAAVFGYIALPMAGFLGLLAGPAALVMGLSSKGMIARHPGRYKGEGMAMAGVVLGAIGGIAGILSILSQFMGKMGR
jgi:hypothetical protein